MREKVKFRISELLIEQGFLKLTLRNHSMLGLLTEEIENDLLDKISENKSLIDKYEELLKLLKDEK